MSNSNYTNYILTDILPAELPIIFSNRSFHKYLVDGEKLSTISLEKPSRTIPVQFMVKKNVTDYRTISLMNPVAAMNIAVLIKKYSDLLLIYFEQNSIFSIRHYNKINDSYVEFKDEELDEIKAITDSSRFDVIDYTYEKYIRSYFNITCFHKITDFYKSYMLKDLEIKYRFMLKMDIENCFGNIYTHSVDWAFLGEKVIAKNYIGNANADRFSAILDKIMQYANYAETHGILVGPEFSRMFAEVILTRIDKNVYDALKQCGIYYKKDYEIIRFIDDIFVFCSSRDNLEVIEKTIKDCIKEYKLSINVKKQFVESVPFLRNHLWVTKAKAIIAEFELGCNRRLKGEKFEKAFIDVCGDDIKCLCAEGESQMQYIVSYFFSAFERIQTVFIEGINAIKNDNETDEEKRASRIRLMQAKWLDLTTQCLVMSITHNNALKFCRMCIKMLRTFSEEDYSIQTIVFKKCSFLIKYHKDTWTELQNVMILLALLDNRLLPPAELLDILKVDSGYLSVSTIVYYLRKRDPKQIYYSDVYLKINEIIHRELVICRNLFDIDYSAKKIGKLDAWICSDHFYLLHDIYSAKVLNSTNMGMISAIKDACKKGKSSLTGASNVFADYIENFDKPFMKWNCSEDELITDFFLEKSVKKFKYD